MPSAEPEAETRAQPEGEAEATSARPEGEAEATSARPEGEAEATSAQPEGEAEATSARPEGEAEATAARPEGENVPQAEGNAQSTSQASGPVAEQLLSNNQCAGVDYSRSGAAYLAASSLAVLFCAVFAALL